MDAQFFALKTEHNLLTITDGPHHSSHCVVQMFLFPSASLATLACQLLQTLGSGGKRDFCCNLSQEIEEIMWSREVLSEVRDGDSVPGISLLIR